MTISNLIASYTTHRKDNFGGWVVYQGDTHLDVAKLRTQLPAEFQEMEEWSDRPSCYGWKSDIDRTAIYYRTGTVFISMHAKEYTYQVEVRISTKLFQVLRKGPKLQVARLRRTSGISPVS